MLRPFRRSVIVLNWVYESYPFLSYCMISCSICYQFANNSPPAVVHGKNRTTGVYGAGPTAPAEVEEREVSVAFWIPKGFQRDTYLLCSDLVGVNLTLFIFRVGQSPISSSHLKGLT